ncbi:unnamed protein product [Caretta caretta]
MIEALQVRGWRFSPGQLQAPRGRNTPEKPAVWAAGGPETLTAPSLPSCAPRGNQAGHVPLQGRGVRGAGGGRERGRSAAVPAPPSGGAETGRRRSQPAGGRAPRPSNRGEASPRVARRAGWCCARYSFC